MPAQALQQHPARDGADGIEWIGDRGALLPRQLGLDGAANAGGVDPVQRGLKPPWGQGLGFREGFQRGRRIAGLQRRQPERVPRLGVVRRYGAAAQQQGHRTGCIAAAQAQHAKADQRFLAPWIDREHRLIRQSGGCHVAVRAQSLRQPQFRLVPIGHSVGNVLHLPPRIGAVACLVLGQRQIEQGHRRRVAGRHRLAQCDEGLGGSILRQQRNTTLRRQLRKAAFRPQQPSSAPGGQRHHIVDGGHYVMSLRRRVVRSGRRTLEHRLSRRHAAARARSGSPAPARPRRCAALPRRSRAP